MKKREDALLGFLWQGFLWRTRWNGFCPERSLQVVHTANMTPVEIQRSGLDVLARALGPYGLICFLQQFEMGTGDYTTQRHQWLDKMDEDVIVAQLAELRSRSSLKK